MRIVVLDDFGLGPENLARLEAQGDVAVYQGIPRDDDELVERADGAEVVLCCWTRMDAPVLERLPRLRMISLAATGTDTVDVETAARRGVVVCRVPAYATNAVAELALGLMLAAKRKIAAADRFFRERARARLGPVPRRRALRQHARRGRHRRHRPARRASGARASA